MRTEDVEEDRGRLCRYMPVLLEDFLFPPEDWFGENVNGDVNGDWIMLLAVD